MSKSYKFKMAESTNIYWEQSESKENRERLLKGGEWGFFCDFYFHSWIFAESGATTGENVIRFVSENYLRVNPDR